MFKTLEEEYQEWARIENAKARDRKAKAELNSKIDRNTDRLFFSRLFFTVLFHTVLVLLMVKYGASGDSIGLYALFSLPCDALGTGLFEAEHASSRGYDWGDVLEEFKSSALISLVTLTPLKFIAVIILVSVIGLNTGIIK